MLFNDFFDSNPFGQMGTTSPAINVIENEKEYKVEIAAPGMSKEDFKIRVNEENHLVISMEKKSESNEGKKNETYLRREFSYTQFEQTLLLPDDVLKDKIEASMNHGVLHINIPKDLATPEVPKERFIEIG